MSPGWLIMAAGSLGLLAFLCWATYRSGLLLRAVDIPFNVLTSPPEMLARLALIAVCVGLGLVSGLPPAQLGWTSADQALDVVLGLAAGVFIQVPLTLVTSWAIQSDALARWRDRLYDPRVALNILPRNRRQWLTVPLAFVSAVVLEELLFRSLLVGGLSAVAPAWLLAAGFALVFGLVHWPQGMLGVVATAVAGFLLAGLFIARGSLLPPLVAHYAVNVIQVVLASRQRETLETLGYARR
ncbi:MAG: CPBP family intramembrane metalloprotease [Chloroflexi bacterium]|nr:CPBP family intramembrane metalloprotease [Chloroflexota bacterium]MBU1750165.1 CPBP family intramembrane metalloprotease [Chloroflexota bacterium]MBU1878795.1 CPBP family intramembrane metalloprotease [Chloroflexota bacterium]